VEASASAGKEHAASSTAPGPKSGANPKNGGLIVIRNLKLEDYRSFKSYELRDLARVNLLVGRNNCGKTSVLEAVHFLASGGSPYVLRQIAGQRGELNARNYPDRTGRLHRTTDASHFFFGHRFDPGVRFSILANDIESVRMHVEYNQGDLRSLQRPLFEEEADDVQLLVVRIESNEMPAGVVLPATVGGTLHLDSMAMSTTASDGSPRAPVSFVSAVSLDIEDMRRMWDSLLIEGREQEVVNALNLVENELASVHFLSANGYGRSSIVLGHQGGSRRTPIGSHGDGTRRLLALALSLTQLSGGVLLVDEIDTGLHWTVLEHLWKLVVEQAVQANIQVFATTHSRDCIDGLASFVASHPEHASQVSVQKVERQLGRSVGFDGADIENAVKHNLDLR